MRAYEVMIIIDTDVDDAGVRATLARVGEVVGAEGGTIATTDNWGRRRFAYEIAKKHEGIYVVLQIVTSATNLDSLDRVLRLADSIVRHKILRLPEKEAAKRGLLGAGAPAPAG